MIDFRKYEIAFTEHLKAHLGCEIVLANQAAPAPEYPFGSYTVTTLMVQNNGTYSLYDDGVKRKEYQQIWSLTFQSNSDTESKMLAIQAHEYCSEVGVTELLDAGISVQTVGTVTNRDNLLTVGFEYRNGFDITLAFMSEINAEQQIDKDEISGASIGYDGETIEPRDQEDVIAELNAKLQNRLDGEVN